jgi:hypothetical protein
MWVMTFQPFLWSKTLTVDFWHIFFGITSIYLTLKICINGWSRNTSFLFIFLGVFACVMRPPFLIIALIEIVFIFFVVPNKKKYWLSITPFLVFFIFGIYSFFVSLNFTVHRGEEWQSKYIELNALQDLFFYDSYIHSNKLKSEQTDSFPKLIEMVSKQALAKRSILNGQHLKLFPKNQTDEQNIEELFSKPNHAKYFTVKSVLNSLPSNSKREISKLVNQLIIDNYLLKPLNLITSGFNYFTSISHSLSARNFIKFNRQVIEVSFTKFNRDNGPNSLKLYNTLKFWIENSTHEEILRLLGTNYEKYEKNWLDNDEDMFKLGKIEWMPLYNILNVYNSPIHSAKLMAGVNKELVWRGEKETKIRTPKEFQAIASDYPIVSSLINTTLHMYRYHIKTRTNDFFYYWDFLQCLQPGQTSEDFNFRVFKDFKPIIVNNIKRSANYQNYFDQYLHYTWEATRIASIITFIFFIPLMFFQLGQRNIKFAFLSLALIFSHSFFEMWYMGSHFKYTDHTLFINWIFMGIVLSKIPDFFKHKVSVPK